MFERNDDVLYVCYDNEAYMNTGVQRSSATPPAARTANTKPVGDEPGNVFGQGKSAPLIAMAHEIPYVATATVADLHDLEHKIERAMEFRGARYVHVLVPCPLGWGSAVGGHDQDRAARTRDRPLPGARGRARRGRERRRRSAGRVPVEEYLRAQRRFAHLFGEPPRTDVIEQIQARADRNIRRFGLLEEIVMEKPFAITLDVGSSLANKTGSWRTERPVYVHRLPPCANACPAGENVQQWLYDAEEGGAGYERAWRQIMEDNPFPAVMGRVCYHPCETVCNRAQLDEAVGINSVERFLGDEAIAQGWRVEVTAPPSGKRVLVVGAGPSGLSAAYHLARLGHAVTVDRRRPASPAG